ncbi:MAG: peptidyl-prolyl cis-trans isomerase [Bacteroidota bacterium]
MHKFSPFIVLSLLWLASCDYFKQEDPRVPIARVNDTYLYEEDVANLVFDAISKEDSVLRVNNYINRWATQQLMIDQAKINLTDKELDGYDKLVDQYRIDLYTEAYKSGIVSVQLDSTITQQEMELYYDANKENFKLNDQLIKVRYIRVAPNFGDVNDIQEKLRRFDESDKLELEELSIQFHSYNFNDSTWVKKENLIQNVPAIQHSENQVLKKSNFTQLQDSLGVYLVKIEDILNRNDTAPLSFVGPTIEQIILNKRKLELIKKLEKDITKDAIKDKKFETFTKQ